MQADARLTLVPGTYEIPHWEKGGPIWSAMINVAGDTGLGNQARGELVIDEITAPRGKSPAMVRGHLWICVDPIAEYPGPQWVGGTFAAEVKTTDDLYREPTPLKVEAGRILVTRPLRR